MASVKKWLKGTNFLVYCSHFLSAWGDRMWQFGVGLFLIDIAPGGSLQLTAIFGLSSGAAVLTFGPLLGDWVDNTRRLKAAQLSLVIQNLCVVLCAGAVFAFLWFRTDVAVVWDGWLQKLSYAVIIILAILATLASIARMIAVERDWIVEICGRDKDMLAHMTSTMRRIDLATKILAPIATGQIMTYVGLKYGAVFIGAWNVVSVFFEYYLIWKVYNTVPALRKKKDSRKSDRIKSVAENDAEDVPMSEIKVEPDHTEDKNGQESILTGDNSARDQPETPPALEDESDSIVVNKDDSSNNEGVAIEEVSVMEPIGENNTCEESKPDEKSCCSRFWGHAFYSFTTLYRGWKTYMQYDVANAGLGLACLFLTVLGFDNVTVGFSYSQGLNEATLGYLMAASAVIGIFGTFMYPILRRKLGLERTGLFALLCQIACLSVCVVSVWMPGSPFKWYTGAKATMPQVNCSSVSVESGAVLVNSSLPLSQSTPSAGVNETDPCSDQTPTGPHSFISVGMLLAGIITARFGLWTADLTITQLFLERVVESERGIVNGVQSSLNQLMDMLKYAMVVSAPEPELFGILVLISFAFICIGLIFYSTYSYRARGHLLPHCSKCENDRSYAVAA